MLSWLRAVQPIAITNMVAPAKTIRAKVTELHSASSRFDRDEAERRQARVAIYDRLAEWRERNLSRRHYYSLLVQRLVRSLIVPHSRCLEIGCGLGDLLASLNASEAIGIDLSPRMVELGRKRHPHLDLRVLDAERGTLPSGPFDFVILSDVIGQLDDIQQTLERLRPLLAPSGRLIVTYYNYLWQPILELAERLRLKTPWPPQSWLSMGDLRNLLHLSDFEVVRDGADVLLPIKVPLLSKFMNNVCAKLPGLREGALVDYFVCRPVERSTTESLPSVSIVCPCKDEKGNIREAVARTPLMGAATELVFVDGNSTDGTREEILAVIDEYKGPLDLRLVDQQNGHGKGDAVRKGFAAAKNDVFMILDSDLTVPPEDLPKFYSALVRGKGDFINGVRLVYPMEDHAMRFLNHMGNKFFSIALSWVISQPIKDSLCGTKVLYRRDYERIAKERHYFGDFDPFGDFDLLFGAARLNMKIIDLPVRYRGRTYGSTKISRFTHGALLMKMTAIGFKKLRLGI